MKEEKHEPDYRQNFYLKATKAIILFFNLFADIDLPGRKRIDRKLTTKVFVIVKGACYVYCNIRLILCCFVWYRYDHLVYNHRQSLSRSKQQYDGFNLTKAPEALLLLQMEQIKQARALARSFGAPYLDWHFVIQACIVCGLLFALYSCILQPLYLNFIKSLKYDLLCLILDEGEGRKQVDQLVARVTQDLNTDQYPHAPIYWSNLSGSSLHRTIEHQLAILEAEGRLKPANRQREWILHLCKFCSSLSSFSVAFIFSYIIGLIIVVPRLLTGLYRVHVGFMDLLVIGEALTVCLILGCCLGLYYTIMGLSLTDQISTVTSLIRDLWQCIGANNGLNWTLEQKDRADRSLLDLIVRFKLFRLQTKAVLPFNGQHLFVQAKLGAFTIITAYTNAIHFNLHFWMVAFGFLIIILGALTMLWLPTCYMHSRCEDLYRALYSLNAHIICLGRENKVTYNLQLVDILNRELMHPDKLLDDFACQFLGIRFTYRNLMKYLFFYNLGIILTYFQYRNKERPTSLLALL